MKRTISVEVGKGSVNHNSRKFKAENVDGARSHLNIDYCNERIQDVYQMLFGPAQERFNARQTRADRRIPNYYEKICAGHQEKPFHEIIIQIGNKDDMSALGENAELAKTVLNEYYQDFQSRNPNLYVFSAHLHMDEATPHLHIDFVPFITGSKRGLDTRVSLKQALAAQGFKGGTRSDTERNQWVRSEKADLAVKMARYFEVLNDYFRVNANNGKLYRENENLRADNAWLSQKNDRLEVENRNYSLLRKRLGKQQLDALVEQAKTVKHTTRNKNETR